MDGGDRMIKKIISLIGGKDCELKERMLRSIILIGGLATLIAITEIFFVMEMTILLFSILMLILLVMGFVLFITYKYQAYDVASTLLGLVIIVIVFPVMFVLSAGIASGAAVWLSLGIIYIFLMFSGKKMMFFLFLSILSYGGVYVIAYYYPEVIVLMPTKAMSYIDSIFSVFAVGIVAGLILKLQMKVYEEEHKLNIHQRNELEKSSQLKDSFFANMSHEIRTPINAIKGLDEMILRVSENNEVREYARDIQVASDMLLNQVNDILDISQMEVNMMKLVPVDYNLKYMLVDLIEMIRVQLNKKGLELYVDVDKNLPLIVNGDEKRLKQILLNILDNAVKYTEEGSITLSVVGEEYKNDTVKLKIKVADTGIGIRKENLTSIYDAFSRYDEARNKRILGTGLGLAITKELVDMMEGEITVDSIYRKGTVFTVVLTQKILSTEAIGELEYTGRNKEEYEKYKPLFEAPEARILVADDNKMNRMVVERLLVATKVKIDTVSSGAECLEKTKEKYYQAILLDYMMPDMNGLSTLRAIRGQENGLCRDTAIIALTGNTVSGARQMYLEQGFDGYVEKPIQGKILEREILQQLPKEIVEYQEETSLDADMRGQIQKLSQRKRKKIYITADCTCDIPQDLLEKYDIKLMYLYIKTPNGRFADTREIDSDSIAQYITPENTTARGDKVSVEDFEEFFAEALTQAEEVIHIALSSKMGLSYSSAARAAEGFDHVHVIDSGMISCGQGLVTLHAAKLATEGKTVAEICESVNEMKNHIHVGFVLPGADIFYQSGRIPKVLAKICHAMQLHPYAGVKQKKTRVYALLGGSLEKAWRKAVKNSFFNKRKINTGVVFIAHVGCSVKQQDILRREIMKRVPFERVISNKTSFTTACSTGLGTIGYAYYTIPKKTE